MATLRRNHLTVDFIRSPYISERRRKLFPVEDQEMDSELGHMSPIRSESDSDIENDPKIFHLSDTPMSNRCSETMSPLKLSPCTTGVWGTTPKKFSPSQNLKTPHDTSTKPVLEKEQKTLLEECKSLKRKGASPDGSSPELCKIFKSDTKPSKVRTALFPPESALDMALPTKSFYSKNQENILDKLAAHKEKPIYKPVKFSTAKHGHRHYRKLGQINNGVRHKIRKPKQKKMSKSAIAKATKKMLATGSALNEYIQDLSELRNKENVERKLIQEPALRSEDPEMEEYLKQVSELQKNKKLITTPLKSARVPKEENKENIESQKRSFSPLSPSSPDDKRVRKFFKSSRGKPAIGLHKDEIIKEESKKFTLPIASAEKSDKITLDSNSDFEDDDNEPDANIDNILSALNADSPEKHLHADFTNQNSYFEVPNRTASPDLIESSHELFKENLSTSTITLEAHTSILASDTSIQLHKPDMSNMILSPISHMCDVTSGLALNSPIRGRDLNSLLNMSRASKMLSFNGNCHSADMTEEQRKKLFPIFHKGASSGVATPQHERGEKRERTGDLVKKSAKKFKALAPDQMLLDAGQKKFGLTLCNECNIVYHMGDPNDELQHLNYHNAQHVLRFSGWKNEHIVVDFQSDGRIIKVLPNDSKIWLKKVKDLMEVVKRDLGCYEMDYDISQSQVYLYIKNRSIAGCAVATVPKERGHRMLSTLSGIAMCSEESYPIKCGISHIWVASNFRKQGVASALLDAVKSNFIFGRILSNNDIALTSPTEAGSAFAEKYFKTPNYMIYYT